MDREIGLLPLHFQEEIALEGKHKILILAFGLLLLIISTVSAATISIVDDSYLGQNQFTITDQNGIELTNFTGPGPEVTLPQGKSYSLGYEPRGLFDLADETASTWPSMAKTLAFADKNIAGILAVLGVVVCVGIYARYS